MMGCSGSPNKYVCPNDRQLALRAKLRSGWCVPRGVSPLTPAEQAAILEVIRRSEAIGLAEARRVGRLVERVEALQRASPAPPQGQRRCRACSQRAPLLQTLKICVVCRHCVCSRCAVESAHNSDRWLCNICAETREMWKKSGAWFYKGLPQYVLPERRGPPPRLAAALVQQDASGSSQADGQDSSDENIDVLHHGFSAMSLNRTDSLKNKVSHSGLSRGDSLKQMSQSQALSLRRTSSRSSARSAASNGTSSNGQYATPGQINGGVETLSLNQNGYGSSYQSPQRSPASVAATKGVCGTAEVRLLHDPSAGTLHCTAVRARNLPSTDLAGLADPYCSLEMLPPDGSCSNRQRTKTVHKTRNPEFNETVTFYGVTDADISSKTFRITLLDEDKYGCDILGSASLPLDEALAGRQSQELSLPLIAEEELTDQLLKPQILVSLSYNTKKRSLAVVICRCRNLPAMDSNGFSDPFVKLHLEPDPYHKKHKTSIKWRNLNPVYNEEFLFETRPTELSKQCLALAVWDKDYGKSNDFLGSLVIGASSKGKRLKHWLDCIKFPDHRHEQWHCLTETEP